MKYSRIDNIKEKYYSIPYWKKAECLEEIPGQGQGIHKVNLRHLALESKKLPQTSGV